MDNINVTILDIGTFCRSGLDDSKHVQCVRVFPCIDPKKGKKYKG